MCLLNNQNPSETQPLLEEHVETGQIRLRNSKYRYYILAVVLVALSCLGAGLIIYYAEGKLHNMMYIFDKKKKTFKIVTK